MTFRLRRRLPRPVGYWLGCQPLKLDRPFCAKASRYNFSVGQFVGHLSHLLGADFRQQRQDGLPKGMARLLGLAVYQVADRCLSASAFGRYLWLRQLAVTLDVGDDDVPLHLHIITDLRYFYNGVLIPLFRILS